MGAHAGWRQPSRVRARALEQAGCGRRRGGGRAPVDFDIFSAFRSRWPLVRMPRGHSSGAPAQMAVWLYSAKDRWLLIRSLPDTWPPPARVSAGVRAG